MFIKAEGVWHQVTTAETGTVCHLKLDDAYDFRLRLPAEATLCGDCARAGDSSRARPSDGRQSDGSERWARRPLPSGLLPSPPDDS